MVASLVQHPHLVRSTPCFPEARGPACPQPQQVHLGPQGRGGHRTRRSIRTMPRTCAGHPESFTLLRLLCGLQREAKAASCHYVGKLSHRTEWRRKSYPDGGMWPPMKPELCRIRVPGREVFSVQLFPLPLKTQRREGGRSDTDSECLSL